MFLIRDDAQVYCYCNNITFIVSISTSISLNGGSAGSDSLSNTDIDDDTIITV